MGAVNTRLIGGILKTGYNWPGTIDQPSSRDRRSMVISDQLVNTLQVVGGICWTLTYLFIIKRGFQDRSVGMPLVALASNVMWEFTFSFVVPHDPPQLYVDYFWFVFDLIIVYQALRFGPALVKDFLPRNWFYPAFILALVLSLAAILAITDEFEDWDGPYTAFGINVMMSVLYVYLLLRRNNLAGQSLYIALLKMVGTAVFSILFYLVYPDSVFLNFTYVAILIFDLLYIVLVYRKARELGLNPWRRV
jgi:hypothetical protein